MIWLLGVAPRAGQAQASNNRFLRTAFRSTLADARQLAGLDPGSDDYHFLRTRLERNRNRVEFALRQALDAVAAVNESEDFTA